MIFLKQKTGGKWTRRGFSLVEVAIALLLVGMGFTALLQMFPHALRASKLTREDTTQTFFANAMFTELRASAAARPWSDWNTPQTVDGIKAPHQNFLKIDNVSLTLNTPSIPPLKLRGLGVGTYRLLAEMDEGNTIIRVTLWCTPREADKISDPGKQMELVLSGMSYYTELYYTE